MEIIKRNGSYQLIKFSDSFLILDYSNKNVGIAVKVYISEEQELKEFGILLKNLRSDTLIKESELDCLVNGVY
ncbi:Uncharacterised protein [Staphylococcus epidermidis]|uniref:hypothetical protein n=1 Tax=Staphylococcus epidermidis TaxID=1282 RepID=UPI000E04F817|nr:hypothetical protein [Staphylococcus epidermidis]SUM53510.1 Uncharacterised protein [Staphylococcus epidermidis]SUM53529.1 Uncharacterised protein [Staphylococcus epidermidis]